MQIGVHIGQFQQFLKIGKCGVAAPAFKVAYKRRTVDWREHLVVTTNRHRACRVTSQLGELCRRFGALLPHPDGIGEYLVAVKPDTGLLPDTDCLRIIAKRKADVLEHPVDLVLDFDQLFFIKRIKKRQMAFYIGWRFGNGTGSTCALSASATSHVENLRLQK